MTSSCEATTAAMLLGPHMFDFLQGWCEVQVETRKDANGSFGLGRQRNMTFGRFLDRLAEGDTTLYLTTQEVCLCFAMLWYPEPRHIEPCL